jgi:Smr domain
MLLGIGTKVKFLHAPEEGVITDKLGNGMVMVLLRGSNMEIPASEEDLVRVDAHTAQQQILQHFIGKPIPKTQPTQDKNAFIASLPAHLAPKDGLQLGFEAIVDKFGDTIQYDIFLLNGTKTNIFFSLKINLLKQQILEKQAKLDASKLVLIGNFKHDDLNELPDVHLEIQPLYTSGMGETIVKPMKLKPQLFFKKKQFSAIFNKEIVVLPILTQFETTTDETNDLKKYTQDHIKVNPKLVKNYIEPVPPVQQFADFQRDIDLHIEMLHDHPNTLTVTQILDIQLREFDRYLSKSVRMGVSKVYIIHGLGKGRLRELIHARLRRNPYVSSYKNEYHNKYGYGATEVVFANT